MGRGPKKHQKRLSAPSHWLLDKLSGAYAPKASPGPHVGFQYLFAQGAKTDKVTETTRLPSSDHLPPKPSEVLPEQP